MEIFQNGHTCNAEVKRALLFFNVDSSTSHFLALAELQKNVADVTFNPLLSNPTQSSLVPPLFVDTRLIDTRLIDTRLIDTRLIDTRLIDTRLIDTRLIDKIIDRNLIDRPHYWPNFYNIDPYN
jgi:hypothetical protein